MLTLKKFNAGLETIPATTSWYLAEISESKGKQELYKKQSPQRLNSLKEHALIEAPFPPTALKVLRLIGSASGRSSSANHFFQTAPRKKCAATERRST